MLPPLKWGHNKRDNLFCWYCCWRYSSNWHNRRSMFQWLLSCSNLPNQGSFGDIGSYSQLKIVPFFPIHRKKIPIESYKMNKNNLKSLKSRATSLVECLNDGRYHPSNYSFCSLNHLKIAVMCFFPIFNKTPLKFPMSRVWVMFPKYWENSLNEQCPEVLVILTHSSAKK